MTTLASRLAPTVEVCEALLLGEAVPVDRLDAEWVAPVREEANVVDGERLTLGELNSIPSRQVTAEGRLVLRRTLAELERLSASERNLSRQHDEMDGEAEALRYLAELRRALTERSP